MLQFSPLRLFLGLYIAGGMGLFAVLFVPVESGSLFVVDTSSTPLFMGVWFFCYIISLILFAFCMPKLHSGNLMICIIPIYYLIASLWSLDFKKSLMYSGVLLINAFFCMILQRFITPDKFPAFILRIIIVLCCLGGISAIVGFQNAYYMDIHDRATLIGTFPIRGFFNHKITAGLYTSFGFVIALCILKGIKKLLTLTLLFTFVLFTGSSTGLSLLVIGFLLYTIVTQLINRRVSSALFLGTLISIISFAIIIFLLIGEDILLFLNRDPTLTGRIPLWSLGIKASLERFLSGWGYFAYNGSEIALMSAYHLYAQFDNYMIPHFHNSYVQFLVEAGWVFGTIFIGLYFHTLTGLYRLALYNPDKPYYKAMCLMVLIMMIAGIFVHTLGRYNNAAMIIFMYALSFANYFSKSYASIHKKEIA